jgi:tetratricopeptide (TPR) repeat protein
MLRQLMGAETFDQMLRDYYKAYAGRNITLDEFEAFASKAAGRDLRSSSEQWIDSTGVPEFRADYRVLRTRDGFRVPGTVRQDLDTFEMPVEILLRTESGNERQTLAMKGTSADFDILSKSKPLEVIVDPDARLLRSSEELRQGVIVRRGIEHFREQEYVEAEQQFQAAIKLNRGNSWAWYNLGLLYVAQRNWNKALDAFDQGLNGSLRPDWIEVWSYVYRGNCWDMIGQRERAVAEYNKAVSNGSDYDNAQAAAQAFLASPTVRRKSRPPPPKSSQSKGDRRQDSMLRYAILIIFCLFAQSNGFVHAPLPELRPLTARLMALIVGGGLAVSHPTSDVRSQAIRESSVDQLACRYYFENERFIVRYQEVLIEPTGRGHYRFKKKDMDELTLDFDVSPRVTSEIQGLLDQLAFFDSTENYQHKKDFFPPRNDDFDCKAGRSRTDYDIQLY